MHFATPFYLGLITAAVLAGPARPQDPNNSLKLYAAHVGGGYGVYLGNGIVITVAHVTALAPRVKIAGTDLPARVVKRGDSNDVDLALLSIDEHELPASLKPLHMPLCQNPPGTGDIVAVAIPEGVAQSSIISPYQLPPDTPRKFYTAIHYINPGNSGSGVFDANEECLLGIISQKISIIQINQVNGHEVRESHDVAKYFVPASEIAKFVPPEVRF
jgi:S1-C subfamily serine protease